MPASKKVMVYLFSIVGCSATFIFGILNLINGNKVAGEVELSVLILAIGNVVALYAGNSEEFAGSVVLALMCGLLLFLLSNGGIHHTGIVWFFMFPTLAFYLKTWRTGIVWSVVLWVGVVALWAMGLSAFDALTLRQLAASYVAVSALMYFHNYASTHPESAT